MMEEQLNFTQLTGKSLIEWFKPLLNSFTDDGAISYLLNSSKRYRASPLSSTIEWLTEANLIPTDCLDILQNKLIYLRDNSESIDTEKGVSEKFEDDNLGWSLSEGVSVWSTSTALLALFDKYGNWKNNTSVIKESTMWLVNQRNTNGAWSYQKHENCVNSVIMTSLAIRAICKMAKNNFEFSLSSNEKASISEALQNGFIFLSDKVIKEKHFSYWKFQKEKSCVATTWALLALNELKELDGFSLEKEKIEMFYRDHLESSLNFIINQMPKKTERWKDEQIVFEGGAKYNKQKNYQSLSVTLLPQLFKLGLSPFNPKVICQIKWLIEHPDDWKINTYDRGSVCSFSYAMVISTLAIWINQVGRVNASLLIAQPSSRKEKFDKLVFGLQSDRANPFQMILKTRIRLYFIALIIIFFIITLFPILWSISLYIIRCVIALFVKNANDIFVNLIASAIWAIIVFICALIVKRIR